MCRLPNHPARPALAPRRRAFSLLELLVVIAVIAVLLGILIPVITRARAASHRVTCLSNLRQIAAAFHVFANRSNGSLPDASVTQVSWESSLLPYTAPRTFACPADSELFPSLGSSYDWRDTPDDATTLAGKPITSPGRSSLILAFEALPGFHRRNRICAARLDGSAADMDYAECMRDLDTPNDQALVPP